MKFLVATDGCAPALRAVKYAAKLIALMNSPEHKVTLVSVHDDAGLRHARTFVGGDVVQDYLRELSEKELRPAQKVLDAASVWHDTGAPHRQRCRGDRRATAKQPVILVK